MLPSRTGEERELSNRVKWAAFMFCHHDIKGNQLPRGAVCFTYDDGPGPHTCQLGQYLSEQRVPATFFVVGRHVEQYPDVLGRLRGWGHLIGNHTYSHPGLVSVVRAGGNVVTELEKTDRLIRPHLDGGVVLFRPPYGNWREQVAPGGPDRETSVVAEALNRSGRFPDYVGPINWDITGEDWEYWRRESDPRACAERYLAETEKAGSGIILMHDSSEEEFLRVRNQTLLLTRLLVPMLKARGYHFVRLDAVPQVQAAVRAAATPSMLERRPQAAGRSPVASDRRSYTSR
jgi:peptidoglycan/xylan/chitin deacetylase (PgdA/CDA1 family)